MANLFRCGSSKNLLYHVTPKLTLSFSSTYASEGFIFSKTELGLPSDTDILELLNKCYAVIIDLNIANDAGLNINYTNTNYTNSNTLGIFGYNGSNHKRSTYCKVAFILKDEFNKMYS